MVRNKEKYEQAVTFRKRGFTYSEIAKICNVSKATVSNWLSQKPFSRRVRRENTERAGRDNQKRLQLFNKARSAERRARYKEVVRSAETEFRHYKKDPLFIAGLNVYLAAGDITSPSQIRFSSTRLEAQRVFVLFAKAYLGVDEKDVRVWLLLYRDHDETRCLNAWSRSTGIPRGAFRRSQRLQSPTPVNPLHFGTLNTIIGSTVLKQKLSRWLELASKELR